MSGRSHRDVEIDCTQALELLRKDWRSLLEELVGSAERSLFIAAPFITRPGVEVVQSSLSSGMREQGGIQVLTSLDVLGICQGTCDPLAIKTLLGETRSSALMHLPRLHAKVYTADDRIAIVTSGNLTCDATPPARPRRFGRNAKDFP